MIRKHFRLKKIALGLAFAALAVPTRTSLGAPRRAPRAGVLPAVAAQQPIASEISVQSGVPPAAGRGAALAGNGQGL